jgi:hypothetical protein
MKATDPSLIAQGCWDVAEYFGVFQDLMTRPIPFRGRHFFEYSKDVIV